MKKLLLLSLMVLRLANADQVASPNANPVATDQIPSAYLFFDSNRPGMKIPPSWPTKLTFEKQNLSASELTKQLKGSWRVLEHCEGMRVPTSESSLHADGETKPGIIMTFKDHGIVVRREIPANRPGKSMKPAPIESFKYSVNFNKKMDRIMIEFPLPRSRIKYKFEAIELVRVKETGEMIFSLLNFFAKSTESCKKGPQTLYVPLPSS